MKLGILGGTFDPVHNGHLLIAEKAREHLGLAEVKFLPSGRPWLKMSSAISPAKHRVEMVKLAIEDRPYFNLLMLEVEHTGPSYSVDTMAELKKRYNGDLLFIIGWDSLAQLPRWREPERLVTMCRLVVVPRPGFSAPDLKQLESAVPGISDRVILMDEPRVEVSATEIRQRVSQGLSISHLVPEAVERYIKKHRLYTKGK